MGSVNNTSTPGVMQISTRSIEAAMVAQILKDAMDPSADIKIVDTLIWEKDDGLKENLSIRVHPSFPNESVAFRRVNERIESWITGGKPPVDKNAIFRLVGKAGVYWDISMESFEKAVLSDDGLLAIGLGRANGMVKEPMSLMGSMRLRLFKSDGSGVSRKECLDLIRRAMQSKKKEKMQAAREIAKQEDEIVREQRVLNNTKNTSNTAQEKEDLRVNENGPVKALVQQLKERDDKKWVKESPLLNEKSQGIQSEHNEFLEPKHEGASKPAVQANIMIASASQFKILGQKQQAKQEKVDIIKQSQENDQDEGLEDMQWDLMNVVEIDDLYHQTQEKGAQESKALAIKEDEIHSQEQEKPEIQKNNEVEVVIKSSDRPHIKEAAVVPEKESKNKIQINWVREVFPALPEGWDEILISIQADRWNDLMEVLQPLEVFELRVVAKEIGVWTVGLAIPAELFKQTTPLFVQFATGGVMFKRAKK